MRPISLRVRGLHSYREPQTVDFTEVTRAGTFGVFGPTGAGKSTLLDTITLALFGRVDRASHGTQGILNQLEDSLEAAFAFELNGGDGRRRYRVERRYNRVKDHPASVRSGACRLVETLADGGERVLADSNQAVTEAVTSLLGLTADDFTRAVVLPQGRFAEFLRLTGAERSRMLQRLFGLERYGQLLAERVRGELARVEPDLGAVQAEQAGLGDASAAALDGARQEVRAAGAAVQAAERRFAEVRADWEAWNRVRTWQTELDEVARLEAGHAGRATAAAAAGEELDAARRADAVRPYLEGWDRARSDQRQIEELLPQLAARRESAESARREAAAVRDQARERRRTEEPDLQRRQGELREAVRLEEQLRPLRQAHEAAQAAAAAAEEEAAQAETLSKQAGDRVGSLQGEQSRDTAALRALSVDPERRERLRRALEALGGYRKACQTGDRRTADVAQARIDRDAAVEAARGEVEALAEVEAARREAAAARAVWETEPHERDEDVTAAALAARGHRAAVDTYVTAVHRHGACMDEHRQAEADRSAAVGERRQAEAARTTAEEDVGRMEAERSAAATSLGEAEIRHRAAELAASLQPGEPCPVCGSLDHPAPVRSLQAAEVKRARDRLGGVEESLAAARETLAGSRAAEEAARVRQEAAATQAEAAAARLRAAEGEVGQAALDVPPDWRPPGDRPAAADLAARVVAEEASNRERRAALDAWTAELQARREQESAALQRLLDAQGRAAERQSAAAAAAGALRTREAALEEARAGVEEAAAALAAARGEAPDEGIEEENRAVAQADRESEKLSRRLSELSRRIEEAAKDRQEADARRTAALSEREDARRRLDTGAREVALLDERLERLTAGAPATDLLADVARRLGALDAAERNAQAALDAADEGLRSAVVAAASAGSRFEEAARQAQTAWSRLGAALRDRGFASHEAARAGLRTASEQDALEGVVRRHQEEATRLREERRRLETLLEGRSIDEPTWRAREGALRQAEADLEAAQQALGAARRQLSDLEGRHARWRGLEQRRARLALERDDLVELQGALRGAAFVEFLAEEQLRAVARDASGRLARLTRGRYVLEVEPHEGFVIRDDHNGGIRRPVSSLSGGETFLTSLSLALALSAQIQLRGRYPLEFFFLDEGFGSLDRASLETAMDALERLHEEHLAIGVISHLPEVRARMPVRIVVEPAEAGGTGSRLRVEVA